MYEQEWTPLSYGAALRGVDEAIAQVADSMPAWRRRIFLWRIRRHVAKHFPPAPGAGGFGHGSGVREPRRPLPTRPSAAMALPVPRED